MNPAGLHPIGGLFNSTLDTGIGIFIRFRFTSFIYFSPRKRLQYSLRPLDFLLPCTQSRCSFSKCYKILCSAKSEMLSAMPRTEDVVVRHPDLLEKKKADIREAGSSKLRVIADFDGTLTKYRMEGRHTSHGLLQLGNSEYDARREELYNYYHPLEYSPTIPIEEKMKLMEEWWEKSHGLLIEGGLTLDAIKRSVSNSVIGFRDGVVQLLEYLEEMDIPVLIFSAGLADIIEEVFRQKLLRSFKNICIVSNRMVFDDHGRLISFKGKTIHVLNKNEYLIDMSDRLYDRLGELNNESHSVKKRTNVLLLGDHIADLGMSDGLNYNNQISVGFLNDNIESSLQSYSEAFDIVYLNNASMVPVVDLAVELCSSED